MRSISRGYDDWLVMWPEMIDGSDDEAQAAIAKHGATCARKPASPSPSSARANKLHEPDASVRGVYVGDAGR